MAGDDYSLAALCEFLDFAAEKGLLKQNTASSRKQAANKILGVLDEPDRADLRPIDPDEAFKRFTNLRGNKFTPSSMRVYHSRMKSALADFLEYKRDPAHFKPASGTRMARTKPPNKGAKKVSAKTTDKTTQDSGGAETATNTVSIPVPIRPGLMVEISNVPLDLTEAEATKIAGIVTAYAMPRGTEKK